jgi:hypothetical protein
MLDSSKDYQSSIYAPSRRIDARITFIQYGTPTVYDDNYITQVTLVEEMSTLNDSLPSNELQVTLDNTSGIFDFLNFSNMNQIIASRPAILLEFGLEIQTSYPIWQTLGDANAAWSDPIITNESSWNDLKNQETVITTEWMPMGKYYLDSWKNDVGALTVTLIAHDFFASLDNISYGGPGYMANRTLYDIALDILNSADFVVYEIDPSLQNYTTSTGFKEAVTARVALQHVGIAGMCAIYQDRNGVIQIKPFASLGSEGNYSTYPGTGIYSGFDPFNTSLYSQINDGNGMRRLDLDNMWSVPEISLEKSIYQLSVNVYRPDGTSSQYLVNNTAINGNNGESFSIDNPLINTIDQASKVANWYMKESNYNVIYSSNWRGNPILENGDICIISNGINLSYAKSARLFKTEWQYAGYLSCQSQMRGGF